MFASGIIKDVSRSQQTALDNIAERNTRLALFRTVFQTNLIADHFHRVNPGLCTRNVRSVFFNTDKIASQLLSHGSGRTSSEKRIHNNVADFG